MEAPVALIIRFATSIPDVSLTIASPTTTSIGNVKRQLRTHLPEEERKHGLRLIHSGRVLEDRPSVVTALRLPSRPGSWQPGAGRNTGDGNVDAGTATADTGKGKGKQRAPATDSPPIFLHCAISSFALSPAELAAEIASPVSPDQQDSGKAGSGTKLHAPSTAPQARGFDRLLQNAGFSRADVAELRAQHTAIISSRHTPDTMPSQQALFDMEETWLDAGLGGGSGGGGGIAGASTGENGPRSPEEEDEQSRVLADTLYGAMMGFFWPIGALTWGFREDGIWSKRRKEMVLMGLILNVVFGIMSVLSL